MPGSRGREDAEQSGRTVFCSHQDCQCEVPVDAQGRKRCGHGLVDHSHPDLEPAGIEECEE